MIINIDIHKVRKTNNYKKKICSRYKLKLIAKSRGIKDYKSKSKHELIKILSEPLPKIKEIRKNLYEIENEKHLFTPKIKEIKKNLLELEKNLFELKKFYDYDDTEYK